MGSCGPLPWGWSIYINYLEFFCTWNLFIVYHLFISVCTHRYLFYTLEYNPILCYLFYCSNCYIQLASVSLWHTSIIVQLFLCIFFLSGTARCYRLILYAPCPSPRIRHFSRELWFCLLENRSRNQDLSTGCANLYWGVIVSRLSQWAELGITCVYANMCTYIYLIISVFIHMYL